MKLSFKSSLLIIFPIVGIIYAITSNEIVMHLSGYRLIYCIFVGISFGLINFFITLIIYNKYEELKKTNRVLHSQLKIDKLTGLLNRRAFDFDIKELSNSKVFSVIFIDIDNFKNFNDEFGHQCGDLILKKVSDTIKKGVRLHDKVYRYGGEEIIILLIDCDKNNALEIAEKIRIRISELDNSPLPPVTISLGISNYPEDGNDMLNIIKACDDALIMAKSSGKNRTHLYTINKDIQVK